MEDPITLTSLEWKLLQQRLGSLEERARSAESGTFLKQLRETFYPVAPGGPDVLTQHKDRTLFLCWPPYRSPMAVRCLTTYPGSRLVYIGEDWGGNCATDTFFQKLAKEWSIVAFHDPVRWYRYPDSITVYERKVK